MCPVSSGEITTLVSLSRATGNADDVWASTAMVTGERASITDLSSDQVAADLGDLVAAGLARKRQDPLLRGRKYVWCITEAGVEAIASHGQRA